MKRILLVALSLFVAFNSAYAELKPAQLGLVMNDKVPESMELAKYYSEKRGVPATNILKISVAPEDIISRSDYEEKIVAPIRSQLTSKNLAESVRMLVTFYGVPLKVGPIQPSEEEQQILTENARTANETVARVREIITETTEATGKKVDAATLAGPNLQELVNQANASVKAFSDYQSKLVAGDKVADRNFRLKLQTYITDLSGLAGLAQSIQVTDPNSPAAKELEVLKADVAKGKELLLGADRLTSPKYRSLSLLLTRRLFGAIGVLQRTVAYAAVFTPTESDAAVDSELTLLWWDHLQYQVSTKIPSPFNHTTIKSPTPQMLKLLPTLMTARLDASSPTVVKRMIDDSLKAEAAGLKGIFQIDARGMKPDGKPLAIFDQKLRDVAWMVREDTKLSVEVENTDATLSKPGDAKDVALYIGWYKLRHYEDAFEFNPGSVGFHVASEEAVNLHDPEEKGWCKNALDHGLTATLGAVAEPYLDAFPQPVEFFGLLMTGRYTLGEVYFLTQPFISWRVILIGDPLYSPFKNNGQIKDSAFAKRSESGATLNPLPPSPADREFPSPIAGQKTLNDLRQQTEKALDGIKIK